MTIKILDCSIRDGGYVNNWRFSKELVRECYRALSKSGVEYIELGFRSSSPFFDPDKYGVWRFTQEDVLKETISNIQGAKLSIMVDFNKYALKDFIDAKDSCIHMVRMAVHKNNIYTALEKIEEIKKLGYAVSLQCMGYNTYTEAEKKELIETIAQTEIDYIYVADSYGSIFPFQIETLVSPFVEMKNTKVGFHPHNNVQMAFANTLEAIRAGVDIVDTTIYGIGRGAGNLPTEIMLSYLSEQGLTRYNVIPVLNCIERYFLELKKTHPWGYQLPYMISGIFNSHPSYSKELLRRREYSMEDIWKALGAVKAINPIGFDKEIIDGMIEQGIIGRSNEKPFCPASEAAEVDACSPAPAVPYFNRHQGREFLVLANGPSLKTYQEKIGRFISEYKPVVLGANFLNSLFKPDYHAFNNAKRFISHHDTVSPESRMLIGINLSGDMIREYVKRDWEPLVFRNLLDTEFDLKDGMVMANCRTISVLLIGVAVAMGAKRVFIAGMDGYINNDNVGRTLFYDEMFDPHEHEINIDRHRWNERYLTQIDDYIQKNGGEGIHILTPTGHSAFYKSIENYI